MDESSFDPLPVAAYGFVLLLAGLAYYLLVRSLLKIHESSSALHKAIGKPRKEMISLASYCLALILAFWNSNLALALYIFVACLWPIPDRRIEKHFLE